MSRTQQQSDQETESSNLSTIGAELKSALSIYTARLYAIDKYARRFGKEILLHDLEDELISLHKRLSVLQSIEDPEDEDLANDIEEMKLEMLEINRIIEKSISEGDTKRNRRKLNLSHDSKYEFNVRGEKFYFDPSVLPSSFSSFSAISLTETLFTHNHFIKTQFVSLITEFELLLSKIARIFYGNFEGSLDQKEVKIKIEDIKKFSNLSDIKDYLVEGEVFKLTSGSIEDWKNFVKDKFEVDLKKVTPDWDSFLEYFARRNLCVHNDGIVNAEYLKRNKKSEFKIGDNARIELKYLRNSTEEFLIVGSTLILMTWNKLCQSERVQICEALNDLGYHALINSHWRLSERLYTLLDMYGDDNDKIVARMNKWLSIKNQGRIKEIQKDLDNFDHNIYNPRFSLAVYSLLGNSEKALEVISKADIGLGELLEWPILSDLRRKKDFEDFLISMLREQAIQVIDPKKLDSMNLQDLKQLAKSNGLNHPARVAKSSLIEMLKMHREKQLFSNKDLKQKEKGETKQDNTPDDRTSQDDETPINASGLSA